MQLHIFDDVSLRHLQRLFVCMYQLDFQSPFLFTGAFGLYSYLMYLDIIVQVMVVILGTSCMWDSSLYFYLAHDYASCTLWFGPLFTGHTILCTLSRRA